MKIYTREYHGKKISTIWRPESNSIKLVTQATGICFNEEGKILIINDGKKWHLPGGHPKGNETLVETVTREVKEEACVEVDHCILAGFSEIFFLENPNTQEGDHFYQARLVCKVSNLLEICEDTATGITFERKFIDPSEFLEYINWPDAKELLNSCLKIFKESSIFKK